MGPHKITLTYVYVRTYVRTYGPKYVYVRTVRTSEVRDGCTYVRTHACTPSTYVHTYVRTLYLNGNEYHRPVPHPTPYIKGPGQGPVLELAPEPVWEPAWGRAWEPVQGPVREPARGPGRAPGRVPA